MKLEDRVAELERRLERYHAQLETAIAQRDRFVLKASWRAVKGAIVLAVYTGALLAGRHWFPGLGWPAVAGIALLAAIAALLVTGLIGLWLERIEADDKGKFWRLPRWEADQD